MKTFKQLCVTILIVASFALVSCGLALSPPTSSPSGGNPPSSQQPESGSSSPEQPESGSSTPQQPESGSSTPEEPENGGTEEETPDGGNPEQKPTIPDGQTLVHVYFYTMTVTEDEVTRPLTYQTLIAETATLENFFTECMDEMQTVGSGTEYASFFTEASLRAGFWQIGGYLAYGEDILSQIPLRESDTQGKELTMYYTPSGAGANISFYVDTKDSMPSIIPFPWDVYLSEFVDWMYETEYGFFDMSYADSVKAGVWTHAETGETLSEKYLLQFSDGILFTHNASEEEIPPSNSEFTVYMPAIYEYYYSETGEVRGVASKTGAWTVLPPQTSITVGEAFRNAYGEQEEYTFHFYQNGVQVTEDTSLNKTCAVVAVEQNADVALTEFSVTVWVEGKSSQTYVYTRPVTVTDVAFTYCTANGLRWEDYEWTEYESVSAGMPEVIYASMNVYGYIYEEPPIPTSVTVNVTKYDGVEERKTSYTAAYGSDFDAFVKAQLLPAYDAENLQNNEYAFFRLGESGLNEYTCAKLTETTDVLMIKRSVMQAGYSVSVDMQTFGAYAPETREERMYRPETLRTLIWEITGNELSAYDSYFITVNGENIASDDKVWEAFDIRLYYQDIEVVVRPIYKINAVVKAQDEQAKSKTLTYTQTVYPSMIYQDLGLSREMAEYVWKYGTYQEYAEANYHARLEEHFMFSEPTETTVYIGARTVFADLYFTTSDGQEFRFETSGNGLPDFKGWEWSVTAGEVFKYFAGEDASVVGTFDEYTWTLKTPDGEQTATAQTLLEFVIPAEYDYYDEDNNYRTVYSLTGMSKNVQVSVSVTDANYQTEEKGTKSYAAGTTLGDILTAYGYTQAEIMWWNVSPLNGGNTDGFWDTEWTWTTAITRPIELSVQLK